MFEPLCHMWSWLSLFHAGAFFLCHSWSQVDGKIPLLPSRADVWIIFCVFFETKPRKASEALPICRMLCTNSLSKTGLSAVIEL